MPGGNSLRRFECLRIGLLPAAAVGLATALAVLGCDKATSACPPGTVRSGDACVATGDPGTDSDVPVVEVAVEVITEIAYPDEGPRDVTAEAGADAPPDGDAGDVLDAEIAKDVPPADVASTDVYPAGIVGKKCQSSLKDCKAEGFPSASCSGWTNGYCIIENCGSGEGSATCPEGSTCMGITLKAPACAKACASDGDCRAKEGYACKLLPDPSGALTRICHEVKIGRGPGEGCTKPSDCAGEAGCLTSFTGGYCAVLSCSPEAPCAEGTTCVRLGGEPVCLKSCGVDADCQVDGDLPRSCISKKDAFTLDPVKVCGSAATGGPIGAQCLNETECASGRCDIAVTGECRVSLKGCKVDTDCGLAEPCMKDSTKTFGFCTAGCSPSKCTPPALCIETFAPGSTTSEGRCMGGCTDAAPCRTEAGLQCRFGDPLWELERYACTQLGVGETGTVCSKDVDCVVGTCLIGAGKDAGYCTVDCQNLPDSRCPFPTFCGTHLGQRRCMVRCRSDEDCIGDTACDLKRSPPVCVPTT